MTRFLKSYLTAWLAFACLASAEVRYTVVPLIPNDPNIGNAGAGWINRFGDAAGSFYLWPNQESHGFVYTDGIGFVDLGILPSVGIGRVTGINDAGQVAAYSTVHGDGLTHALRYTPGVGFVDLGTGPGRQAETTAINNTGQVVGFFELNDGSERAFRYTDGVGFVELGRLPGAEHSGAYGINDAGWVTGGSGDRAFLYTDEGGIVDIGPGTGVGINDSGVVVGQASFQPVIYMDGQAIPLAGNVGRANDINNFNVVVGTADVLGFTRAFIWSEAEGIQDLNLLIDPNSGWFLAGAGAINDAGQIVGLGFSPERGAVFTAFRLDPIPEPTTWALLTLAGVLLLRCRCFRKTCAPR